MSETRLLKSVVDIMAEWGDALTAFEAADKIVALVRKTDAATLRRKEEAGNTTMAG